MNSPTINDSLLICRGSEIQAMLNQKEIEVISQIREAYLIFNDQKKSEVPHSSFLRFPHLPDNRIIALPAYAGGAFNSAGIKWISSFPSNIHRGIERASALIILNSLENGRAKAIFEGSIISAVRTAASASLIAKSVLKNQEIKQVSLIGCGPINFHVLNYLRAVFPSLNSISLFDTNPDRAEYFKGKVQHQWPDRFHVKIFPAMTAILEESTFISFATSASHPYVQSLGTNPGGKVVLNISLRDLAPEILLSAYNIVDDRDHVNRANTSVHLAWKQANNLDFVNATISDHLINEMFEIPKDRPVIVSPFGLGILDVALAEWLYIQMKIKTAGSVIEEFFPEPY